VGGWWSWNRRDALEKDIGRVQWARDGKEVTQELRDALLELAQATRAEHVTHEYHESRTWKKLRTDNTPYFQVGGGYKIDKDGKRVGHRDSRVAYSISYIMPLANSELLQRIVEMVRALRAASYIDGYQDGRFLLQRLADGTLGIEDMEKKETSIAKEMQRFAPGDEPDE
jgi:hypothetical protein